MTVRVRPLWLLIIILLWMLGAGSLIGWWLAELPAPDTMPRRTSQLRLLRSP